MAPITDPVTVDLFITACSMRTAAAHSRDTAAIFNKSLRAWGNAAPVVTRRRLTSGGGRESRLESKYRRLNSKPEQAPAASRSHRYSLGWLQTTLSSSWP